MVRHPDTVTKWTGQISQRSRFLKVTFPGNGLGKEKGSEEQSPPERGGGKAVGEERKKVTALVGHRQPHLNDRNLCSKSSGGWEV